MSEEAVEATASGQTRLDSQSPEEGTERENQKSKVEELGETLAETNLAGAVGQTKREMGTDRLSKDDVQELTESYKSEIKSLEDKLKCVSSDKEALMVAEENQKLKKRNQVLLATNTDFINKYTALDARLQDTMKERDELTAKIEALESATKNGPSQCHPGGDIGASVGTQPKKGTGQTSGESPSVDALKGYLSDYATLAQNFKLENIQLHKSLNRAKHDFASKEVLFKKVISQLRNDVKQRDAALSKVSHGGAQAGVSNVHPQEVIADQHKHLVVELTRENKELKGQLKYKDEHIVEQENKIEKLTLRCAEAEKNAEVCDIAQQRNSPADSGNVLRIKLDEKENKIRELQQLVFEYEQRKIEMDCELEKLKNNQNPDASLYNEQLKAFQEDYIAEREEKQRIMEESRRLHEDNQHLRHELQSRSSSQSHFSSPPPNTNPPFESMQTRTPPVSLAHQQPEFPGHAHGQMPQQVSPPQGPPPNSGYPANYPPEYRRANTIPPRSGHPGPYYSYPPDPQFYPLPVASYPGEVAHEAGAGYQVPYRNPTASGQRSSRNTTPGSTQVRSAQDRHAPR